MQLITVRSSMIVARSLSTPSLSAMTERASETSLRNLALRRVKSCAGGGGGLMRATAYDGQAGQRQVRLHGINSNPKDRAARTHLAQPCSNPFGGPKRRGLHAIPLRVKASKRNFQ
eukprot:6324698-Alexandrium_andersonii.AAC.1